MLTTPEALAVELGISPKTLRAWLRMKYPNHRRHARWLLDKYQVAEAQVRFMKV